MAARWVAGTPQPEPRLSDSVAYVFVRGEEIWTQQARLTVPDVSWGDPTGNAIAISGERIVVGGSFSNELPGPLSIFERSGGSWSSPRCLRATGNAAANQQVTNVAISGDTIAGLAPFAGGENVGGIYIFRCSALPRAQLRDLVVAVAGHEVIVDQA